MKTGIIGIKIRGNAEGLLMTSDPAVSGSGTPGPLPAARIIPAFLVLLLLHFAPVPNSDAAEPPHGALLLKQGKSSLDSGRLEEAIKLLSGAAQEFPLLEDHALYFLAEAHHKAGDHSKAQETIRKMLDKHPLCPSAKKARFMELREASETPEKDASRIFEAYIKDYPDDDEAAFLYARRLKQNGDTEKAVSIFRKIYVRAGSPSGAAAAELSGADIRPRDLIERAEVLMKRFDYREAEQDLKKALAEDDGKNRQEILKNLAFCLFGKKEYREAAEMFDRVKDSFYKARSLYRSGDKPGFSAVLAELSSKNDRRAGMLMLAAASDKRREGNTEEALKIYSEIAARYPSEKEDALWGRGWTFYVAGEFGKAAGVFAELHAAYQEPKYLYWQARSIESAGQDAAQLYKTVMKHENNFYAVLCQMRIGSAAKRNFPEAEKSQPQEEGLDRRARERVDALLSIGFTKEATAELTYMAKKAETASALLYIASRLFELGEFRQAVAYATRIPYSGKIHRFWYPLAFWPDVEKISKKADIDPFMALSIMREESRFDADAKSSAGARGLMQLMPSTAYKLDKTLGLGIRRDSQINEVKTNISLGSHYLKSLFSEFGAWPYAIAAYNAGEHMVRKWARENKYRSVDEFIEDIPYSETRNYVKRVLTSYYQYKSASETPEISSEAVLGCR